MSRDVRIAVCGTAVHSIELFSKVKRLLNDSVVTLNVSPKVRLCCLIEVLPSEYANVAEFGI